MIAARNRELASSSPQGCQIQLLLNDEHLGFMERALPGLGKAA